MISALYMGYVYGEFVCVLGSTLSHAFLIRVYAYTVTIQAERPFPKYVTEIKKKEKKNIYHT